LISLARQDDRIVAITAAMPDGTGLSEFRDVFPDRMLDVGISESHAVATAAGLAKGGLRPVVAIYSTFMQRAFDQVYEEICLQGLPVVLCMDRAGLVGSDGAVHHGFADIAYLRPLAGITLLAPADEAEMSAALTFAMAHDGPVAIRYPRDEVPPPLPGTCPPFELGRARVLREGKDATILAYGPMVEPALAATEYLSDARGIATGVMNARFAKPLDVTAITRRMADNRPLLIVEDHARIGGLGSAVLELISERNLPAGNVRCLGIPDRFIAHASRDQQLQEVGLDVQTIAETISDMVAGHEEDVPVSDKPGQGH
jgi:1-deoxy-D-xylulose-5-phosphate synthase